MDTNATKENDKPGSVPNKPGSVPGGVADCTPDDLETRCGFDWFHPTWLQRLASKKAFVLVYGLIGGSYFAHGSYYVATITTVEKRFKMSSKTTGIVTAAMEISSIFVCLIIAYLGSRGGVNKTRWVAIGTFLVSTSCFINVIPHLLYGAGHDALELARGNVTTSQQAALCGVSVVDDDDCTEGEASFMAACIFFVSRFILGVGTSMYWTLGVAYLDDNVRKTKTPLLLSVVSSIRMLGPTVGFLFASYSLGLYIDPSLKPSIDKNDPRWIGAWWLGWIPAGVVIFVLGCFLGLFPKTLPRAAKRLAETDNKPTASNESSFADFKKTLKRLLSNPVIVFNTLSIVCFIFGYIGYWTFMPKYMETQFRKSASDASLITGSVGLVSTGVGLLVSGAVVTWFKPRARLLAGWNVFVEMLEILVRISYVYIGCPVQDLHGSWSTTQQNTWDLKQDCNSQCDCLPNINYAPVCSFDKSTTFYSSCHAGCSMQGADSFSNQSTSYLNCSCISGVGSLNVATEGACVVDCHINFLIFLACECFIRFLSATGRAGNTIIQFRCVNPEDKSVSIGLTEVLLCAFAFIPGPILYGMILDSSCLVWGVTCGVTGNCWLYDGQSLRYVLNLTAAGFMLVGTMLDVGVWYHVKGLLIYDEDHLTQAGHDRAREKKKQARLEGGEVEEREPLTINGGGAREEQDGAANRDDGRGGRVPFKKKDSLTINERTNEDVGDKGNKEHGEEKSAAKNENTLEQVEETKHPTVNDMNIEEVRNDAIDVCPILVRDGSEMQEEKLDSKENVIK